MEEVQDSLREQRAVLPGGALLSDASVHGGSEWVYPFHSDESELDWLLGWAPAPVCPAGGVAGACSATEGVEL